MKADLPETRCELLVIGTGMAGMAAALFAANREIDTVQVGITGEINFASGLLDLLGVHPVAEGRPRDDPWEALRELAGSRPAHPYARLDENEIRGALQEFLAFLADCGHPYRCHPRRNTRVIGPVGTLKTTWAVPETMAGVTRALRERPPGLVVDFAGMKGFSARQIRETLGERWPALRTATLPFPGLGGELYSERMARSLETEETRRLLAEAIRPVAGPARVVGLPAVLGVYRPTEILRDLQRRLEMPVFEIPTMPPSVPGLRLREAFESRLRTRGVAGIYQKKVLGARRDAGGDFLLAVGHGKPESTVRARTVVLASGRFFGGGLHADRGGIRETVFDLPVAQPPERAEWHHRDLFHPTGHPVNRAGVEIDDRFRPVDTRGRAIYPNLYAAGAVLAHQDWIRQKCGSGLAIATAFGAVRSAAARLR